MSSKLLPACLALLIQQALDWGSPSSLGSGWLSYYGWLTLWLHETTYRSSLTTGHVALLPHLYPHHVFFKQWLTRPGWLILLRSSQIHRLVSAPEASPQSASLSTAFLSAPPMKHAHVLFTSKATCSAPILKPDAGCTGKRERPSPGPIHTWVSGSLEPRLAAPSLTTSASWVMVAAED